MYNLANHAFSEDVNDLYNVRWISGLAEYRPECNLVQCVKCLGEIYEQQVDVLVLLTLFLHQLDSEDHIHYLPCHLRTEAALQLTDHNLLPIDL